MQRPEPTKRSPQRTSISVRIRASPRLPESIPPHRRNPCAARARLYPMWRIYGGAITVIAGIAAFIEAHSHPPELESRCRTGGKACPLEDFTNVHIRLNQTASDL